MTLHFHQGDMPPIYRLGAHDLASADDRAWFAKNQGRNYRIRRAFMGEGRMHPDMLAFIAIKQVAPGARVRVGFFRPGPTPETEAPEGTAEFIFGELTVADCRVGGMVESVQRALAERDA